MTALELFDLGPDPRRFADPSRAGGTQPPAPPAVARPDDPETSHAAARAIDSAGVCALVMSAHRLYPDGLTDSELCGLVLARSNTVVSARTRLTTQTRQLVDSGQRRPSTETGRAQTVWTLA